MVRLRDIANAAQVSVSTASRALSGQEFVAAETRDRIKRIASELGYETNLAARGLRRTPNRMIAALLPDTRSSSFSSEASQLLHQQLNNYGYGLLLCSYHRDRAIEKNYLESLPKLGLSGLFHKPLGSAGAEALAGGADSPHVVEFLRASRSTKLDQVVHDDSVGSMQVIEHLAQLGHRRFGLIVGPKRLGSSADRVSGVLRALDFACIDRESLVIRYSEHSVDGGSRAFREILAHRPRVTAVYAAGSQLALGAAIVAREDEIAIPERLSLVGLGDPQWARLTRPRLTTYTLPVHEMVMTAALLMVARIEKPDAAQSEPVQITISGRLNLQGSSGSPPD